MKNPIDHEGIHAGETLISWSRVREVAIRTTADGPFADDLFWVFVTRDGVFELPGSLVSGECVGAVQAALPHLDNLKVIMAMGSTSERIFRLWHVEQAASAWDEAAYTKRFTALIERLGGQPSGEVLARLVAMWSEAERRYHNLEHLTDCLRELDASGAPRPVADIAELALWYHDAVYVAAARGNEERSAELLTTDARLLQLSGATVEAACACIAATQHGEGALPAGSPAELVVDIDLAILGREPLRFMDYEYAMAEEYASVPWTRYVIGRGQLLRSLLERPQIFHTPQFVKLYEEPARANLGRLLASPRYSCQGVMSSVRHIAAEALYFLRRLAT